MNVEAHQHESAVLSKPSAEIRVWGRTRQSGDVLNQDLLHSWLELEKLKTSATGDELLAKITAVATFVAASPHMVFPGASAQRAVHRGRV